jgi:hypothetical protein
MTATMSILSVKLPGESLKMTELDNAMMQHMRYIVLTEKRPFSYQDFRSFGVNDKEYGMEHGTFRNKVSQLIKAGKVEREYISRLAFYTLKGVHFGKGKHDSARMMMMTQPMTPNHMGVSSVTAVTDSSSSSNAIIDPNPDPNPNHTICNIIQNLPPNNNSVHDIHLKFQVPDIWTILSSSLPSSPSQSSSSSLSPLPSSSLSSSSNYKQHDKSKDIALPLLNINNLKIRTTVHRTDTVTVIVACSNTPIVTDTVGIIRLSNALTRVEERLSRLVDECGKSVAGGYESLPIPEHNKWIVTMWHFGHDDASNEYTGQKYCSTWRDPQNALIRKYTKRMSSSRSSSSSTSTSTTIIRKERIECPNKTLPDAIEEKLHFNTEGGSNSY